MRIARFAPLALALLVTPLAARAQDPPVAPPPLPPPPPPPPAAPPPAAPPPAAATPPDPTTPAPLPLAPTPPLRAVDVTTLRILREKGVLTQAEYDSALRDIAPSTGAMAEESTSVVVGRSSITLYGFLKSDAIYDSTQSFQDVAGNNLVERPEGHPPAPPAAPINFRGEHGRTTFSVRNSRFGLRLRAPELRGVRVTGLLEADFLGPLPPIGNGAPGAQDLRTPYDVTEAVTFTNPVLRLRHANVKIETPIVDLLFGQYWHLFGWQNTYQPGMVQAQGGPGHVYGRTPQIRVSKTFASRAVTFEIAAAALRPPQRDSATPEGQAGMRLSVNEWTGLTTGGATATNIMPLSIAVTGDVRNFVVPEFNALPKQTVDLTTTSLAVNGFFPILPATRTKRGNALSLQGEFVYGNGIADLYTQLTGGMQLPVVANTTGLNPPPQYPQNVDNGMVVFDLDGNLHGIKWTTFFVGAQYSLPKLDGKVWLAVNYSHMQSPNIGDFTRPYEATLPNPQQSFYVSAAQVLESRDFFDVNVFFEPLPAVRFGLEYANTTDTYVDGVKAVNHRGQLAAIFLY